MQGQNLKKMLSNYSDILSYNCTEVQHLPKSPNNSEKFLYVRRNILFFYISSLVSFITLSASLFLFFYHHIDSRILIPFYSVSFISVLISLINVIGTKNFDLNHHKKIVKIYRKLQQPNVDIFLPNCGEDIAVLENTWNGVRDLKNSYSGKIVVYCLDDANREEVKVLSKKFGFKYYSRPNRGQGKKAGNLQFGFSVSRSKYIVIFDADFKPNKIFLDELMPYLESNNNVGIVQSPQYFDIKLSQGWLERGAGSVQEFFYRSIQVSRMSHNASICVGSNAIYRRKALKKSGGFAQIEHSEDVHTGFNMNIHGYHLQYVPVIVAKGLCPSDMQAFFKQQYRWCAGSLSLIFSQKFWSKKMKFQERLSYLSGFFYYLSTALSVISTPIIPLMMILIYPNEIKLFNYLLILPTIFFSQIVYPLWHKSRYSIEAWSVGNIYGWAHLFAFYDNLFGSQMAWQPTGSKIKKDTKFVVFRLLQFTLNLFPGIVWVVASFNRAIIDRDFQYLPLLFSGLFYMLVISKISFYNFGNLKNRIKIYNFDYIRALTKNLIKAPVRIFNN